MAGLYTDLPEDRTNTEFHDLFMENRRRVFGYILTLLPKLEDAEEVYQAACVVILEKSEQFKTGTDFAKWACQIAHFEVLNYRRRKHREFMVLDGAVLEAMAARQLAAIEGEDLRQTALQGCLGKLNKNDRKLIESRYRRNVTTRQLAAEISRPAENVYKSLQRIRRQLQQCIERTLAAEGR